MHPPRGAGSEIAAKIDDHLLRRAVIVKSLELGVRGLLDMLEFLLLSLRTALRPGVKNRFECALFEKAHEFVLFAIGHRSLSRSLVCETRARRRCSDRVAALSSGR